MERFTGILSIIVAVLSLSCTKEVECGVEEVAAVHLEPSIHGAQESTRAAVNGTNFAAQNGVYTLGVCIFNHNTKNEVVRGYHNLETEINVTAGTNENEFNQIWKYYFDEGGGYTDKSGNKFNYATDYLTIPINTEVDVYAYYPWNAGVDDPAAIPFTSGDDDWMWAAPVKNVMAVDASGVQVPLQFRHAMTCIEVNLRQKYEGSVSVTRITLHDSKGRIYARGIMDSTDGTLTLKDEDKVDMISVTPGGRIMTGYDIPFHIIFPEIEGLQLADTTNEGELTLSFEFNGVQGKESYKLPAEMKNADGNYVRVTALETGKKYKYMLVLDNITTFAPLVVEDEWTSKEMDIII